MHPTIFLISTMGLFVAPSLARPPSVCLLCHVPPRDMSSLGAIPASWGPIFRTYHHQTPLGAASGAQSSTLTITQRHCLRSSTNRCHRLMGERSESAVA
ncbi:hypothetical protein BT93_L2960 [Corymbia citriodora subsp. variegata]|uniref:Secreted protein n=1 Tax=Corymbia citriodora subsp. variegata TaxID=360336 RepID=A0A8T0CID3_CORYI|nr:hypothetical protein BT93_L2960 [Corymbia citriodora subsp. variegata]